MGLEPLLLNQQPAVPQSLLTCTAAHTRVAAASPWDNGEKVIPESKSI